jgi:hypothetical protein
MANDFSKVIGIVAFSTLIISLLAETILSATWNETYFTIGLPLFTVNIPVNVHHANIPSKSVFVAKSGLESIVFREISPNSYGFREKLFQFRWVKFSPVMHGLLIFDNANSRIIVKGFASWSLLAFLLMLIVFVPAIPFFILVMSLPYAIQYLQFLKIANIAAEAWSRKHASNVNGA